MMDMPYYETSQKPLEFGFRATYVTAPGGYHPPHWHEELEILYHLNGESDITIDRQKYHLDKKHMIAIDSRQVHSTYTYDPASMFLCIHISKAYMERYVPDLEMYHIQCIPDDITDENFKDYFDICQLLKKMTEAYIQEPVALPMETHGLVLQAFAMIIRHFSHQEAPSVANVDKLTANRIRTVITYVLKHFREPVSLQDIADELGLGKEYFCRFFKKHMGMSFLQYLNEVRAAHVYQDLERTDLPVSEIMEQNGFTNQKLFNRTFKEIYGCTPSSIRRKK